jgi:lipopolysaccharide/colanic/teichoic acid biosynthesis glycosyltransferase
VDIPEYWQRLVVRPGVTGLAQLRLTREMTWSEKLAHDLEFIADRSLRLYLSVISTTLWLIVVRPANRRSGLNRLP